MITRMLLTLVVLPSTDTDTTIGVTPSVNEMVTDALVLVKVTPLELGLRSDGCVPAGAPTNVAFLMYCGLPIPAGHVHFS
jgi:hypothetical protein